MNQPNNNFFPWDDIQEDNVFPAGCFQFEIATLEDGYSQASGNRMFKAQFNCKAPAEYAGMSHFENYVTGTEENPAGINAGTMGTRSLKKMLKAAQVPQGNDIEQLILSAKGAVLMISLNQYVEKDGPYAGDKKNRVTGYDAVGTKEVKIAPVVGAGKPNLPPQAPPAAPVAPVVGVGAAPTQPAAPATPVQNTVVAPPAPGPAAPPVAPVAPPAASEELLLDCTICGAKVPASQLGAHVASHAQQG